MGKEARNRPDGVSKDAFGASLTQESSLSDANVTMGRRLRRSLVVRGSVGIAVALAALSSPIVGLLSGLTGESLILTASLALVWLALAAWLILRRVFPVVGTIFSAISLVLFLPTADTSLWILIMPSLALYSVALWFGAALRKLRRFGMGDSRGRAEAHRVHGT